jgi:Pyruvate/2-oxoacid:ferredoxin oxidoreductase delta subunit
MCNNLDSSDESSFRRIFRPIIQPIFAWKQVFIYRIFIIISRYSENKIVGNLIKMLGNKLADYYSGTVVPKSEALKIVRNGKNFVVAKCACREIAKKHPDKCCIYVGNAADIWEKLSKLEAERITKEKALEIIERKSKEKCIHTIWSCTSKDIYGICNCCRDCCLATKFYLDCNISKALHMPPFAAYVLHEIEENQKKCSGCLACVKVCNEFFGAREVKNGKVIVNRNKCMACGRCLEVCPNTKLKVHRKPEVVYTGHKYSKKIN